MNSKAHFKLSNLTPWCFYSIKINEINHLSFTPSLLIRCSVMSAKPNKCFFTHSTLYSTVVKHLEEFFVHTRTQNKPFLGSINNTTMRVFTQNHNFNTFKKREDTASHIISLCLRNTFKAVSLSKKLQEMPEEFCLL